MKKIKIGLLSPFNKKKFDLLNNKLFELINLDIKKKKNNFENISCLILDTRTLNFSILEKFRNLKLICRFGVGIDNLDLSYLKKRKIDLCITKKSIVTPVAEHALGFIISSIKSLNEFNSIIKKSEYEKVSKYPVVKDLKNKEVLIIGLGNIGKRIAKILKVFDCKITFYDPKIIEYNNYNKLFKLNRDLKKFDIVSLNCSLNKSTKKIINHSTLRFFKKEVIIVNTSRGGIVDEKSLINFSKKKKIIYCSDVFEQEPLAKNFKLSNYTYNTFTPHISTSSPETRSSMSEEVVENIKYYFINKKKNQNFLT
tara:strand:+ start:26485 stop:27417 length:933 start_codon:yes stop_codon:yes gene_type:complete